MKKTGVESKEECGGRGEGEERKGRWTIGDK
jgi:hypothetical protein